MQNVYARTLLSRQPGAKEPRHEYNEIVSVQAIPVGAAKWRIFKKKEEAGSIFDTPPEPEGKGRMRTPSGGVCDTEILLLCRRRIMPSSRWHNLLFDLARAPGTFLVFVDRYSGF